MSSSKSSKKPSEWVSAEHRRFTQRQILQAKSDSIRDGVLASVNRATAAPSVRPMSASASHASGTKKFATKESFERAWSFVTSFKNHTFNESDEMQEPKFKPDSDFKQVMHALRAVDPCITYQEVEWVLGKEHALHDTPVTFDEIWGLFQDGSGLDVDPTEQSFEYFCTSDSKHLDLIKVGDALDLAGERGLSDHILNVAIKRMKDEQGDAVARDFHLSKKKENLIDSREYRKLFSMTAGPRSQTTSL
ncbi:unnamed protein product [Effrenium voratum]|nr:unnamed protein product [Effrenium voratum]